MVILGREAERIQELEEEQSVVACCLLSVSAVAQELSTAVITTQNLHKIGHSPSMAEWEGVH